MLSWATRTKQYGYLSGNVLYVRGNDELDTAE
jgi:hypothetical protein